MHIKNFARLCVNSINWHTALVRAVWRGGLPSVRSDIVVRLVNPMEERANIPRGTIANTRMTIELHNIDCMEAMKQMPDKAFDLAIVDPPYGIKADEQKESFAPSKGKGWGNRHRKAWVRKGWDDKTPDDSYFIELERVSRNQIIWGANYFGFPITQCCLIWDKMQYFTGSDFELAWTSFDSPSKAFRMSRIEAYSNLNKKTQECGKIHPTQKPVKLYEWILNNYAKEGDKILDTHLGSGSIAIACYNMGYNLTGYEIDAEYYEAAKKRLEEHKRQGKMVFV